MSCTCGGTAPEYPWHEWFCGRVERDDDCTCGFSTIEPRCPEHGHLLAAEFEVAS